MKTKLGVVMDPIGTINYKKDSTFAMLLAAQQRGWELYYMEQPDLFLADSKCHARMSRLEVRTDPHDWYTLAQPVTAPLQQCGADAQGPAG
jgi:glutathione synthase